MPSNVMIIRRGGNGASQVGSMSVLSTSMSATPVVAGGVGLVGRLVGSFEKSWLGDFFMVSKVDCPNSIALLVSAVSLSPAPCTASVTFSIGGAGCSLGLGGGISQKCKAMVLSASNVSATLGLLSFGGQHALTPDLADLVVAAEERPM